MRRSVKKGVRLKGIKVVTKPNGKRYIYHRATMTPLPDLPENHPEFIAKFAAAEAAPRQRKGKHKADTIGALIVEFLRSDDFATRKESTRASWRRRLDRMSERYGSGLVRDITTPHLEKWLGRLTPGAARTERTVWRGLLRYAKANDWRSDNPAGAADITPYKAEEYHCWTEAEIETFRAYWPMGTPQRQAMEVLYWTGARVDDARRLGHQYVKNGVLEYTQEKIGAPAFCPVTETVAPFLRRDQEMFLEAISDNMVWILTVHGKPRTQKGLSSYVSEAASKADLPHCSAHGLRKARATVLANNGWTTHRIAAWTGHKSLAEVEHYTLTANRRRLVLEGGEEGRGGNSVAQFPK